MAVETVGMEIVVNDRGTAVVRRHVQETTQGLQQIERASQRSGAAVTKSTTDAAAGTGRLTQGMGKAQVAASALAGGLSGAGAGAARLTGAMSTLLLTGFNPLGLAIAAAATGIGLLVSKMSDGAESTRKMTEELRALFEVAREGQAAVLDLRLGGAAGTVGLLETRARSLDTERLGILREAAARFKRESRLGVSLDPERLEGTGVLTSDEEEKLAEIAKNRLAIGNQLAAVQGRMADESAKQLEADKKAFELWTEKLRLGTDVIRARTALANSQRLIGDANRAGALEIGAFSPTTPTVGGDRTGANFIPDLSQADEEALFQHEERRRRMLEGADEFEREIARAVQVEANSPWRVHGRAAGDAFASGLSSAASEALLHGDVGVEELAQSFAETFVRALTDALVDTTVRGPLQSAFSQLFAAIPGFVGAGVGGGGGEAGTPGGAPVFTPTAPAVAQMTVKAVVVPEELAVMMPERAARGFSLQSSQTPTLRGLRP